MKTKSNKADSIHLILSSLVTGIFVIISLIGVTTTLIASEASMDLQLTEVEETMVQSSDTHYAETALLNQALNEMNKSQLITLPDESEIGLMLSLIENEMANAHRLEFAEQSLLNNHLEMLSEAADGPLSSIPDTQSKVNLQLNEIEEDLYAANRQESFEAEMLNNSLTLLTSNSNFREMVSGFDQTNQLMTDCCIRMVLHNIEYSVGETYRFESAEDELLSSALYSLCNAFTTEKYGDNNLTRDTELRTDSQPSIEKLQDSTRLIPFDNPVSAIKLAPAIPVHVPAAGSNK